MSDLWLWDASDFDKSRGPMDLQAAFNDGIRGFTHKLTESDNVKHTNAGVALGRGRAAQIPFLGGYHVVRTNATIASQVAYLLSYAAQVTPWWQDFSGWFWQVDLELWPYDAVPASWGINFANALRAAQRKAVVIYASQGQYGNQLKSAGFALWNANYGSNPKGHYRELYPGDGSTRWSTGFSILQYSSNATIGSQPTSDANAARMSEADFARMIGVDVALTRAEAAAINMESIVDHLLDGTPRPAGQTDPDYGVFPAKVNQTGAIVLSLPAKLETIRSQASSNGSGITSILTALSTLSATFTQGVPVSLSEADRADIAAKLEASLLPKIQAMISGIKYVAEVPPQA
jgi:hypothetical protein